MRFFCIAIALSGLLPGQPAPPPQPKVADDKVVATVDGKQYKAGEIRALGAALPAQFQQAFAMDPSSGLQQILTTRYLAGEAAKIGLDKQSPFKEQLEFQRDMALAQLAVNDYSNKIQFANEEQEKYYREHGDEFDQAKVRVIYIAFSNGSVKSDKKVMTEAEAKTRIEDLRKQLLAGADFAKLAKEFSQEKDTAEKGGEWGVIKRGSKLPDEVKKAIFSAKVGDVSEPIKQANGFYLLKVDEFSKQPYDQVSNQIWEKLKDERIRAWVEGIHKRFSVKVEDPDFFPHRQPVAPGPPDAPASH